MNIHLRKFRCLFLFSRHTSGFLASLGFYPYTWRLCFSDFSVNNCLDSGKGCLATYLFINISLLFRIKLS